MSDKEKQLKDMIAYAEKRLAQAKRGKKAKIKRKTGGDLKAQLGEMIAENRKINIPKFKPLEKD